MPIDSSVVPCTSMLLTTLKAHKQHPCLVDFNVCKFFASINQHKIYNNPIESNTDQISPSYSFNSQVKFGDRGAAV